MTQIIKTSTPGKERDQLSKAIVITIRKFMRQVTPDDESKDMVAFIILALTEISTGIDQSVVAWEKRGYWVKADKFRLEWQWAGMIAARLRKDFEELNWPNIAGHLLAIMEKFSNLKVSDRHRMGEPWRNAYRNYKKLSNN